jgi:hypothetical protein
VIRSAVAAGWEHQLELLRALVRSESTLGRERDAQELVAVELADTTDARAFVVHSDTPATCYGPIGDNLHAPDEPRTTTLTPSCANRPIDTISSETSSSPIVFATSSPGRTDPPAIAESIAG